MRAVADVSACTSGGGVATADTYRPHATSGGGASGAGQGAGPTGGGANSMTGGQLSSSLTNR